MSEFGGIVGFELLQGDPDIGLAPGARFKDIPESRYCLAFQVTKVDFVLWEKKC
jgi:rubredoxin